MADEEQIILRLDSDPSGLVKGEAALRNFAATTDRVGVGLGRMDAAFRRTNTAVETTGRVTSQSANRMLAFANIIDDAQYGVRGVANNLIFAAGQFGTYGAAVAVAAAAGVALYNNWDQISRAFGGGRPKTEAEQMDELAKATERSADQTRRLLDYRERMARIAAMERARPAGAVAHEKGITDLINDQSTGSQSGIDRLARGLFEARNPGGLQDLVSKLSPEKRAEYDRFGAPKPGAGGMMAAAQGTADENERKRGEILTKEREARLAQIKGEIDAATQSPEKLQELVDQVNRDRDKFPKDFAEQLQNAAKDARLGAEKREEGRYAREIAAMGGDVGRRVLAGKIGGDQRLSDEQMRGQNVGDISRRLQSSQNMDKAEADRAAELIYRGIVRGVTDGIKERATRDNTTYEQARQAELRDRRQADKAEKEALGKSAADMARAKVTGLDEQLDRELGRLLIGGASRRDAGAVAGDKLKTFLQSKGLTEDEATRASKQLVGEAGQRRVAQENAMAAQMGGGMMIGGEMLVNRRMQAAQQRAAARVLNAQNAMAQRQRLAQQRFRRRLTDFVPAGPADAKGAGDAFTAKLPDAVGENTEATRELAKEMRALSQKLERGVQAKVGR